MLTFGEFVTEANKYTVHFKKHGSDNVQTTNVSADTESDAKDSFRKSHPETSIVSVSKSGGFLHKLFGKSDKKSGNDSPHYKTNHHYGNSDIDPKTIPIFKPSWQNAH